MNTSNSLITVCHCGKKAKFNGRKINDEFTTSGEQVVIDNSVDVRYEPLCGSCYIKEVLHINI